MKTILKIIGIIAICFLVNFITGMVLMIFGLEGTEFGAFWFSGRGPSVVWIGCFMMIIVNLVKRIKKATGKA